MSNAKRRHRRRRRTKRRLPTHVELFTLAMAASVEFALWPLTGRKPEWLRELRRRSKG